MCLFTSSPPRAPTSTLFPYTTLFRSFAHAFVTMYRKTDYDYDSWLVARLVCPWQMDEDFGSGAGFAFDAAFAANIDRKSTRLNSSHPSISYAVFCLKKKKPTQDNTDP